MVKPLQKSGFTLVELMITLVIIAIVLSLAVMTMRGYIPKQRLITSVSRLENLLQRAQSEASSRSFWTCIDFRDSTDTLIVAKLVVDKDPDHMTNGNDACKSDGSTDDFVVTTVEFKEGVVFATGGGACSAAVDKNCVVWFDSTGAPKVCAGCGSAVVGTCTDWSYQFVLKNPNLDTLARAREVEAVSGGYIKSVKPGEKGLVSSPAVVWASSPGAPGGCE